MVLAVYRIFRPAMACRSLRGRSIIALPSTDANGNHSHIVLRLSAGSPVTLSRTEVDYAVTGYGAAALRGQDFQRR